MVEIKNDNYKCVFPNIVDLFINSNRKCSFKYLNEIISEAWNDDPNLFLKLLCFIRDPRNGKGEKDVGYYMLKFLKDNFPKTYNKNIKKISIEYGCLKDLLEMAKYNMGDSSANIELEIFADLLQCDLVSDTPSLASKWAPRERNQYHQLSKRLSEILFPGKKNSMELYRKKILKPICEKTDIVENKMANDKWGEIEYENVPLGAINKYGKIAINKNNKLVPGSFYRHDIDKFNSYNKSGKKRYGNKKLGYKKIIDDIMINGINDINFKAIILLLSKYDVSVSKAEREIKINYDFLDESNLEYDIGDDEFEKYVESESESESILDKDIFMEDDSLVSNIFVNKDENCEWEIM